MDLLNEDVSCLIANQLHNFVHIAQLKQTSRSWYKACSHITTIHEKNKKSFLLQDIIDKKICVVNNQVRYPGIQKYCRFSFQLGTTDDPLKFEANFFNMPNRYSVGVVLSHQQKNNLEKFRQQVCSAMCTENTENKSNFLWIEVEEDCNIFEGLKKKEHCDFFDIENSEKLELITIVHVYIMNTCRVVLVAHDILYWWRE